VTVPPQELSSWYVPCRRRSTNRPRVSVRMVSEPPDDHRTRTLKPLMSAPSRADTIRPWRSTRGPPYIRAVPVRIPVFGPTAEVASELEDAPHPATMAREAATAATPRKLSFGRLAPRTAHLPRVCDALRRPPVPPLRRQFIEEVRAREEVAERAPAVAAPGAYTTSRVSRRPDRTTCGRRSCTCRPIAARCAEEQPSVPGQSGSLRVYGAAVRRLRAPPLPPSRRGLSTVGEMPGFEVPRESWRAPNSPRGSTQSQGPIADALVKPRIDLRCPQLDSNQ